MSQFQEHTPPGSPLRYATDGNMPRYRTSKAAITSLILGILCCVPFITGIGAICFGIIGFRAAGKPGVSGKGLAGAGLALGILSLLGWAGFGGLLGWGFFKTGPDRKICSSFVQDLGASNIPAAQALCAPGTSTAELTSTSNALLAIGPFNSFTATSYNFNASNGTGTAVISGIATFGGSAKTVTITLSHPPGGTPLIQSWQFQ